MISSCTLFPRHDSSLQQRRIVYCLCNKLSVPLVVETVYQHGTCSFIFRVRAPISASKPHLPPARDPSLWDPQRRRRETLVPRVLSCLWAFYCPYETILYNVGENTPDLPPPPSPLPTSFPLPTQPWRFSL